MNTQFFTGVLLFGALFGGFLGGFNFRHPFKAFKGESDRDQKSVFKRIGIGVVVGILVGVLIGFFVR